MTDTQIVIDWMNRPINYQRLMTLSFSKEVYDFIIRTCDKISTHDGDVYKVNNSWIKVISTEPSERK